MNDAPPSPLQTQPGKNSESERTKQVSVAGWTAGMTAFFAAIALINAPTWPVAFGIAAVTLAVMVVCCCILKRG